MKTVKKRALEFLNKHRVKTLDERSLMDAVENMGYTILRFGGDSGDTADIFISLSIKTDLEDVPDSFSYCKGVLKYVFIKDGLPEEQRIACLCIEAGNITLGNFHNNTTLSLNHEKRINAVAFYVYLRELSSLHGIGALLNRYFAETAAAALCIGVLACFSLTAITLHGALERNNVNAFELSGNVVNNESVEEADEDIDIEEKLEAVFAESDSFGQVVSADDGVTVDDGAVVEPLPDETYSNEKYNVPSATNAYYVTKSGKKYHVEGCSYVKDLSACRALSAEEISQSSYEPCKRCIK